MFIDDPRALQSISVLLYNDDTVTVRFLLVIWLPTSSERSWVNPLLITLCDVADVSFTLYVIVSVPLAVQVNSTVVPSIAASETGLTRKTIQEIEEMDLLKYVEDNQGLNILMYKSMNTKNTFKSIIIM